MLSAELPRWLQDALLLALVPPPLAPDVVPRLFRRHWTSSNRDRLHAGRAWELIQLRLSPLRNHPELQLTWERAPRFASARLSKSTDGPHTPAAVQQSYQRVARALAGDPWRFWAPPTGFEARYRDALCALRDLIDRALKAPSSTDSKS
jgi:hypothetical protein